MPVSFCDGFASAESKQPVVWHDPPMTDFLTSVGKGDPALDQLLNDELDKFNAAATPGVAPAEEISVRVEHGGVLVAGVSGWSWGQAAGIGMTWVREDHRGTGVGTIA